jgi:uncharacterized protein (TIGR02646 family)
MIHIKRNRKDENGNKIIPDKKWFSSAKAATSKAINEKDSHIANNTIYADNNVRAALEKLFHNKCSYCECSLTGFDWNVEHFRPKSEVAENKHHPGYYWLIYDWGNLFPSCVFCNQKRKDKPIWGDLRYGRTGGKGTQFPLEDESTRAMNHKESIRKEKYTLLNPCIDNPKQYLTFGIEGQILSVDDNKRGEATIEIFNLFQRRLKIERKKVINNIIVLLQTINKFEAIGHNSVVKELNIFMKKTFLSDNCNYSAVARAIVKNPDAFGV